VSARPESEKPARLLVMANRVAGKHFGECRSPCPILLGSEQPGICHSPLHGEDEGKRIADRIGRGVHELGWGGGACSHTKRGVSVPAGAAR
jgi:hypothetical protein